MISVATICCDLVGIRGITFYYKSIVFEATHVVRNCVSLLKRTFSPSWLDLNKKKYEVISRKLT